MGCCSVQAVILLMYALMCRAAEGISLCWCHEKVILLCGRATDRSGSLYVVPSVLAGLCLEFAEVAGSCQRSCLHQVRNCPSRTLVVALLRWDGK